MPPKSRTRKEKAGIHTVRLQHWVESEQSANPSEKGQVERKGIGEWRRGRARVRGV